MSTIVEKLKAIKAVGLETELPWNVWTALQEKPGSITIFGDQVIMTEDGDYKSVAEVREALDWLANQFGGKVKWSKE